MRKNLAVRQDFFVKGFKIRMKRFDRPKKTITSQTAADIFSLEDELFDTVSSLNSEEYFSFPGFCDVHVHFREPGFSYKETIASGCRAAARGGYTAVCTMPNLDPVPDSPENLRLQKKIIDEDACIAVY